MRREVPVIITFVVGVIMLLSNFIHIPLGDYSLAKLAQEMGTWVIIISAFAVGLSSQPDTGSRTKPFWRRQAVQ